MIAMCRCQERILTLGGVLFDMLTIALSVKLLVEKWFRCGIHTSRERWDFAAVLETRISHGRFSIHFVLTTLAINDKYALHFDAGVGVSDRICLVMLEGLLRVGGRRYLVSLLNLTADGVGVRYQCAFCRIQCDCIGGRDVRIQQWGDWHRWLTIVVRANT